MGFWSVTGKLLKEVAKDALNSAQEVKTLHDRLETRSSEELKRIITDNGIFSSVTEMENVWRERFYGTGTNVNYSTGPTTGPACGS